MKINKTLFISIIIISLFGILMIYSASHIWAEYKYGDPLKYVKNQALFFSFPERSCCLSNFCDNFSTLAERS